MGTRTKRQVDKIHVTENVDVDWVIFHVVELAFPVLGDARTQAFKVEVMEPILERCREQMEAADVSDTELRQLGNVKAAGYRTPPLIERDWLLVRVLARAEGREAVQAAFEDLATAILGDQDTRRAPATIVVAERKKVERKSLSSVTKSSIQKVKLMRAMGAKFG